MSSKIEEIIDQIEEYIEGCKPQALSSGSRIIVNREDIDALLSDLRFNMPKEIQSYQKIISNKEAIMADARARADEILAQAQIQTHELISEHEIMQQAYAQANEVVMIATKQAQEILDNATNDANAIRMSAIVYTDGMLKNMEDIISHSIETAKARNESFTNSLQEYLNIISSNRAELMPQELNQEEQQVSGETDMPDVSIPQE
ncbi:MAG: ATPase [Lachnospiraceae bacterium]|nr:ATPase [Lachnospiraceae bacterium]